MLPDLAVGVILAEPIDVSRTSSTLETRVPANSFVNPAYLEDASGYRGSAEALFIPAGEVELQGILRDASGRRIPVTIAGAGTGLSGGRVAAGGFVLSLEKFRGIEIRNGGATAGAGVLLRDLQAAAAVTGRLSDPRALL